MKRLLIAVLCVLIPTAALARGTMMVLVGCGAASSCPSYGSELATTANATDAGGSETNGVTGFTNSGLADLSSSNTAPQLGTYHLSATADSAGDYFYRDFTYSASILYKFSFYVRHSGTGGDFTCQTGPGRFVVGRYVSPTITSANTTYAQYSWYTYQNFYDIKCTSASTDGTIYIDNLSWKQATPCLGDELYTTGNAASDSYEADSTTGFSTYLSGSLSSVTTDPQDGTYHVNWTAAANGATFYQDLSGLLTSGHKYLVSYKVKTGAGDNSVCGIGTSTTSPIPTYPAGAYHGTSSSWLHVAFDLPYDGTYKYFVCKENGANNNSTIYLDQFSIKEILSE